VSDDERPPPYDPATAIRALVDAPRVGLEAAAAVVDRILAMGRPGATFPGITWEGEGAAPAAPTKERRVELRRARADAERVLDAYGDWARQLLDAVFGLAEGGAPPDALVLGPVAAGATVDADLWLHAPPGRVTAPARLWSTTLTAHDGATIPASSITFAPAIVEPGANGNGSAARPATRVALAVPADAAGGTYHGHVLAHGLPEVVLPVRVEVVAR
jgi:hypothetical protein